MTYYTDRNNVKMVFFLITKIMVIVFCLMLAKKTFEHGNSLYLNISDCITNCSIGTNLFLMRIVKLTISSTCCLFAFFCFIPLLIAFIISYSSFFCLPIFLLCIGFTKFTLKKISIFCGFAFRKVQNWFILLAGTASFYYDWFRHSFFLTKKLCLEPLQGRSLCGSSCSITNQTIYKRKIK